MASPNGVTAKLGCNKFHFSFTLLAGSCHCEDFETSLLSFEKLDRASPDLWPEQLPGVAEFAASCKNPITNSPPKWMAELESEDIEMLKELGSLTTANLMEKVKGLQNLGYQLGLEESREMTRGKFLNILGRQKK
ncbi:protein lin-52 homolog [Corythoichthys intestinalis]|uniref:protein lin-52 homolog n=1 Tax=Corythoichthys intestinalis TaxID=161448 RepID=UPI0025A4DB43|nr:protein lin-52 homolog [Corythoichthys intestinalis]